MWHAGQVAFHIARAAAVRHLAVATKRRAKSSLCTRLSTAWWPNTLLSTATMSVAGGKSAAEAAGAVAIG